MKAYLGIDVGGTNTKYSVYNELGETIDAGGEVASVRYDFSEILSLLTNIIAQFPTIDGIGISIPGGVDKDTGVVIGGGACPGLSNKDIRTILEQQCQLPVSIENDANCATLAEQWLGNGRDCENFICITIGTGIGGGLVLNRKLYVGSHSFAGEFGFMIMSSGSSEIFSLTSSTDALLRQVQASSNIRNGRELFASLGEAHVKEVYDSWVRELARGIYNIASMFDPDTVLIGGGVSAQSRLIEDVKIAINKMCEYDYKWSIQACHLKNDAGKIGAVYKLITELAAGNLNNS